ncbi:E3 SUMO-protein ligase PIAS2 isoform X2 [Lingula anatina]|uniref:E3 SUMO-protein ligase PIAS2 isoform X2 n=1 Tax=Lingula anatina TaxID=7574 RepID=A0A1S3HHS5_LINAN|nr:E3 SUMO-protein ligase PIAS2 isoform X2 [Lingula anatina]|eukprot:XP_013385036.1 E3 SUMO-protein ligase PIAS2 isoform X2 [Lingula anatina]
MSKLNKMADPADLKHMVMSFRVSELQVLLGFAGRNKSGRKNELLHRALQLIAKGCSTPIQIKIKELYRRFPAKNTSSPQAPQPVMVQQAASIKDPHLGSLLGDALDYSSKHLPSSPSSALPIHPDVRLKHLPFYDCLGELTKPTSLVPKNAGRFQEAAYVFHLTPQQAQDVAMSRYGDLKACGRIDYQVQVQLRFCLLETSCEQADNFPPSICVRINGKLAPLPNPIPTNKPGVEPKRPSRPVNITPLCRISPTVPNHITVSWASEFGRGYCVAVYLVKKLTSEILLDRLKRNGIRHPDHSRALIKEKLSHDPDSEIATTSLRVSLICPLGKMRMQIPCRASTCTHLQCFDAYTFLQMNEKKPTWICPVCDKPTSFEKLIIDGLFTEIFRQCPNDNEIVFNEDCSWIPVRKQNDAQVLSSPVSKAREPATMKKESVAMAEPSTSGTVSTPVKKEAQVIDLTLDSSSDEDEDCKEEHASPLSASSAAAASGCVSPPLISLDTPPRVTTYTPPSQPHTPLHSSPHSPLYSSTQYSPLTSQSSQCSSTSSINTIVPTPPPAHAGNALSGLGFNGIQGNMEPISRTEFEDFMEVMLGSGYQHQHQQYYPQGFGYYQTPPTQNYHLSRIMEMDSDDSII